METPILRSWNVRSLKPMISTTNHRPPRTYCLYAAARRFCGDLVAGLETDPFGQLEELGRRTEIVDKPKRKHE